MDDGTGTPTDPTADPDNDAPTLVVSDAGTINEGDTATFNVSLDNAVNNVTTLTFAFDGAIDGDDLGTPTATIGGTAVEVIDNSDGTYSFEVPANTVDGIAISVPTTDDSVFEGQEAFTLNATLSGETAAGTALPEGISDSGAATIVDNPVADPIATTAELGGENPVNRDGQLLFKAFSVGGGVDQSEFGNVDPNVQEDEPSLGGVGFDSDESTLSFELTSLPTFGTLYVDQDGSGTTQGYVEASQGDKFDINAELFWSVTQEELASALDGVSATNISGNSVEQWQSHGVDIYSYNLYGVRDESLLTVKQGKLGVNDDTGLQNQASDQLGYRGEFSETIVVDFQQPVGEAKVGIANLIAKEGEVGSVTAYLNGSEVGTWTFSNTQGVDADFILNGNSFTLEGVVFDQLRFTAEPYADGYTSNSGDSSDYFISSIDFKAVPGAGFKYKVIDSADNESDIVNVVIGEPEASTEVPEGNVSPVATDSAVEGNEDEAITLSWSDFNVSDSADSVIVTGISGSGALTLNGIDVEEGQEVAKADIAAGKLIFTPAENESGIDGYGGNSVGDQAADYANIVFKPIDSNGVPGNEATLAIDITPIADAPDISLDVTRGSRVDVDNGSEIIKVNGGSDVRGGFDIQDGQIVKIGDGVRIWLNQGDKEPSTVGSGNIAYYSEHGNPKGSPDFTDVFVVKPENGLLHNVTGGRDSGPDALKDFVFLAGSSDDYSVSIDTNNRNGQINTLENVNISNGGSALVQGGNQIEGVIYGDGTWLEQDKSNPAPDIEKVGGSSTYQEFLMDLSAQLTDTDGSEDLSGITLKGVPDGASVELLNASGQIALTQNGSEWLISNPEGADLKDLQLKMTVPVEVAEFNIIATVTSTETVGNDSADNDASYSYVHQNSAPTIEVTAVAEFNENDAVVGYTVATFTASDEEDGDLTVAGGNVTFTVDSNEDGYYAFDGENVVLTQAGVDAINAGTTLPAVNLTATDSDNDTAKDGDTPSYVINPDAVATKGEGQEDSDGIDIELSGGFENGNGTISSFVIKTLPANGTLYFDNTAVTEGMSIDATSNSATLTFVPNSDWSDNNGDEKVTFDYIAVDEHDNESDSATATIDVTPVTDTPDVELTLTESATSSLYAVDLSNVLNNLDDQSGNPAGFTVTAFKNGEIGNISIKDSGSPTGFGVAGAASNGASSEIGKGEVLHIELNNPASSATFQLAWLNGRDETAVYEVHYDNGTSETFSVYGGSDRVDPPITVNAPSGKAITEIDFKTGSHNESTSDYLLHTLSYESVVTNYTVDITVEPTDTDHSESITKLIVKTPEGLSLSGADYLGTENGVTTWDIALSKGGFTNSVEVDSKTGVVTVKGLILSVPDDFTGDLTVEAIATAYDPGAATSAQGSYSETIEHSGPTSSEVGKLQLNGNDTTEESTGDTNTFTATLIDGIVEGAMFTTSSGLTGTTDENGAFEYREGDSVTFMVGDVVIGTASAEALADGKVFLQEMANTELTDLNNEYVENMAVFLQSLDADGIADNGITITAAMNAAFEGSTLDLRNASEAELKAALEKVGSHYVNEEEAMQHVRDMLEKHAGITQFDEHTNDSIKTAVLAHEVLEGLTYQTSSGLTGELTDGAFNFDEGDTVELFANDQLVASFAADDIGEDGLITFAEAGFTISAEELDALINGEEQTQPSDEGEQALDEPEPTDATSVDDTLDDERGEEVVEEVVATHEGEQSQDDELAQEEVPSEEDDVTNVAPATAEAETEESQGSDNGYSLIEEEEPLFTSNDDPESVTTSVPDNVQASESEAGVEDSLSESELFSSDEGESVDSLLPPSESSEEDAKPANSTSQGSSTSTEVEAAGGHTDYVKLHNDHSTHNSDI